MSRVTIIDIAKKLSISPSTVSRALRDHPDISRKTKTKVLAVAKAMEYFPDPLAQGLKRKRSSTIGIIVPEIKHHFFSSAISGIEEVAYESDFTIMVCQSHEKVEREKINLRALVSNRIAGLLVSISQTTTDASHFDILRKQKIPVVFFDRVFEKMDAGKVIVDDYHGAYEATTHLIERGYKKIAHLAGPENISVGRNRCRGYKQALIDKGLPVDDALIIRGGFRQTDGVSGMEKILKKKILPDAVFAVNDPVAIGAFQTMKEANIRIPEDMALVGFSNNPVSSLIEPALTTVEQPAYEIGKAAAAMLLDQIKSGGQPVEFFEKVFQTKLIIRKSS